MAKQSKSVSSDLNIHLVYGFLLRMILVTYGVYHDANSDLKYTDVDYNVVTDGAREIVSGASPYNRHTYRYTPLLSIMLLPNITLSIHFGKLLFCVLDCFVAKIIFTILRTDGHSLAVSRNASFLWLYNPVVVAISTRGSSECLVAALVLTFVYYAKLRLPIICGLFLGLAVHFKLYPIIYALPIYLSYTKNQKASTLWTKIFPNIVKLRFVSALTVGFVVPTLLSFLIYGEEYLTEGFLYHLQRRDTRHNFSLYFYALYICTNCGPLVTFMLTFVPQSVLTVAAGFKYGNHHDLSFGLFIQTYLFVAFNKVITSQYFVWYIVLLPLTVPRLKLGRRKALFLFCLWMFAQGAWLLPAYLLEFHGVNAFLSIWLESIAFFCSNVGIVISLIRAYDAKNALHNDTFVRKVR